MNSCVATQQFIYAVHNWLLVDVRQYTEERLMLPYGWVLPSGPPEGCAVLSRLFRLIPSIMEKLLPLQLMSL
jgi:hypothetical protein